MAERKRKNNLNVFFSDEELKCLNEKVKNMGTITKSDYVRKIVLNGYVVNVDLSVIKDFTVVMSRILNDINQVTKKLNTFNNINTDEIELIKSLEKQIIENQIYILKSINKNLN